MKRLLMILIAVLGVAGVTFAGYLTSGRDDVSATQRPVASAAPASPAPAISPPAAAPTAASSPVQTGATAAGVPRLAHVFVIVMENKSVGAVLHNPSAPFINGLATQYGLAADYAAVTHPSLPNYIALTSGSQQGITDDRSPPTAGYAVNAVNLADRIEGAGLTWRAYAENLPSPGYASDSGLFAVRHEPFLYYTDILGNAARRASHVVPFTQLSRDLASASTTPSFAFITPNLCNDTHDCPVSTGDAWLGRTVPLILRSKAFTSSPSLLVVTWDEGSGSNNHVMTVLAGNSVKSGFRSDRAYTHYSLLHTIEAALGLPPLTANDAAAPLMSDFFRR